jgi:hypothetical protein
VGKTRNELERKQLFTRAEKIHYKAYKKNVITFESLLAHSPRVVEYIKRHGQK